MAGIEPCKSKEGRRLLQIIALLADEHRMPFLGKQSDSAMTISADNSAGRDARPTNAIARITAPERAGDPILAIENQERL